MEATYKGDIPWANPISLAEAAGFKISYLGDMVKISSGGNVVTIQGRRKDGVTDPRNTIFWTTSATYFISIDAEAHRGNLPVQNNQVDAQLFLNYVSCGLVTVEVAGNGYETFESNGVTYHTYTITPSIDKLRLRHTVEKVRNSYTSDTLFMMNASFFGGTDAKNHKQPLRWLWHE